MKINDAVFTPFMGYMKSTSHNVESRNGYLVLSKGKNKASNLFNQWVNWAQWL